MPFRVIIDMRETDLWKELEGGGASTEATVFEKAPLEVGDIAIYSEGTETPLVVLERKTAEDLGASQKDGRYREQRARLYALRGAGTSIGYIVESPPWSATLTSTWCRGAFTELNLQQALVRLQLRYTLPVFQASSVKETVHWIRRILEALVADPTVFQGGVATTRDKAASAYTEAIHVKKASNNTPDRIFVAMLLAIPGLGKGAVEAIASATSHSFKALIALTEEQISAIPSGKRKIGKAVGAAVFAALHS
jgi:ERCC4-type nuclease